MSGLGRQERCRICGKAIAGEDRAGDEPLHRACLELLGDDDNEAEPDDGDGFGPEDLAPVVCFGCGNLHAPGVMLFPAHARQIIHLCDGCTSAAMANGGRVVLRRSPN